MRGAGRVVDDRPIVPARLGGLPAADAGVTRCRAPLGLDPRRLLLEGDGRLRRHASLEMGTALLEEAVAGLSLMAPGTGSATDASNRGLPVARWADGALDRALPSWGGWAGEPVGRSRMELPDGRRGMSRIVVDHLRDEPVHAHGRPVRRFGGGSRRMPRPPAPSRMGLRGGRRLETASAAVTEERRLRPGGARPWTVGRAEPPGRTRKGGAIEPTPVAELLDLLGELPLHHDGGAAR